MTSTGFELDQLSYGFSWPVRALSAAARLVDPWLSNPAARRAVKAGVDFCCAASAVVIAVAVGEGIATFGVTQTAALTGLVGLLLVVADALGGGYRTIWRYTSLPDALTVSLSSAVVLVALFVLQVAGLLDLSAATTLLLVLLMLFFFVGAREHGLSIGRELMEGAAPGVELVGFLDDDPVKLGALLNGVPVLGPVQDALAV